MITNRPADKITFSVYVFTSEVFREESGVTVESVPGRISPVTSFWQEENIKLKVKKLKRTTALFIAFYIDLAK